MIAWLAPGMAFPPVERALAAPNGLLAAGHELTPERVLDAYRQGIFPWYGAGQPVLWWSPDPRMVLRVDEFRCSRSLARRIRRREFEIRLDTAFDAVIEACASVARGRSGTWNPDRAGEGGDASVDEPGVDTWITPAMMAAYRALHRQGYAHSVEAWRDGELAGGLYGLALGQVFFGESMFARATDASKVALAALVTHARHRGVPLIDCQQETRHLASLGAKPVRRADFVRRLRELIHSTTVPSGWTPGPLPEHA